MEKITKIGKLGVLLALIISASYRLNILAIPLNIDTLETGDVILLDLDCWSCSLIEDETQGPFSHSGLVFRNDNSIHIGQSLGEVYLLEINSFLALSNKKATVLRPRKINAKHKKDLKELYFTKYEGVVFDHDYTWGDDSYYCSEFIYKILNDSLKFKKFSPKPMSYLRNWNLWTQYFGHTPPQGKMGISPNDFYRSSEFKIIGELSL